MAGNGGSQTGGGHPIEQQAREQTGQRQVRMHIDERELRTSYANGFRTHGTAEEVILDFGMNLIQPMATRPGQDAQPEMIFKVTDRLVLTYYSAKRLAMTLGQMIRQHEQQFGEIELDANKRRKPGA